MFTESFFKGIFAAVLNLAPRYATFQCRWVLATVVEKNSPSLMDYGGGVPGAARMSGETPPGTECYNHSLPLRCTSFLCDSPDLACPASRFCSRIARICSRRSCGDVQTLLVQARAANHVLNKFRVFHVCDDLQVYLCLQN